MTTVIVSVIVIIVLYMLFASQIATFLLERKISRMRPSIIAYLNPEKAKWEETLRKFDENEKIVRMVYPDKSKIIEAIDDIMRDLDVDNKYQLLKQKFRKNHPKVLEV